jgi:hypothetical protein
MTLPSLIVPASLSLLCLVSVRADPTAPVDLTQRNGVFAPAATVTPEAKSPTVVDSLQEKRVGKTLIEKSEAALGDRRAAVDVQEAREKQVRDKKSSRPEAAEQPVSAYNHRESTITTATDAAKPPMVSKYQDSLKAASTANMAHYPALDRATAAKVNRFVFRKNSPEPSPVTGGAPVTPAGGAAQLRNP